MEIRVVKNILEANEVIAAQNRAFFTQRGIYVINLMGGPGAGKTTLLERSIDHLKGKRGIAVIEGDIATSRDAERIAAYDVPTVQINTGGACHLDGNMVKKGMEELDLAQVDLLIVENVGNLVCPAEFVIGENAKVAIVSVTDGDDKPLKYPLIFQVSSVIVVNKIDLLPYLNFDMDRFRTEIMGINPHVRILPISCKTGVGLDEWFQWCEQARVSKA